MSYTPSRGSTIDSTQTETARLLLCLQQGCSQQEGSQCRSTECHWAAGTQSVLQPSATTTDTSHQYQSSVTTGSPWNGTNETSTQQVVGIPMRGLCNASIGRCQQTGREMDHKYQFAAETIWNAVAGRPLDWDILTVHLGDMFGPTERIRRSVLNTADQKLLQTYLNKYRRALAQQVHTTCLTEQIWSANAPRVWPKSSRTLEDLEAAYGNIKHFHCWFSLPKKDCMGVFGQCPFRPVTTPELDEGYLRLLERIRLFLLRRGAERMNTLWDLYSFEAIHFNQIAISDSSTGFDLAKAGKIQRFISCARVCNLAIHNGGRCPGMQLPEGYQACNDRASLLNATSGLTIEISQEVQDILNAYWTDECDDDCEVDMI